MLGLFANTPLILVTLLTTVFVEALPTMGTEFAYALHRETNDAMITTLMNSDYETCEDESNRKALA
jgi:hypothetical protein